MHYVYCIYSSQKGFYIGYTTNINARVRSHNEGKNKSTKNKVWELVYYEAYLRKSDALRRERRLKQRGQAIRFLKERIADSIAQCEC
jgi:putative endonuclease